MKFACVDKSAASRLRLKQRLESAYEGGRTSVGHNTLAEFQLSSKEELFFRTAPAVAVVGPDFSPDEAFLCCREIRERFTDSAVILYLSAENYSLRALRRFEKVCDEVFSVDEPATRLLHVVGRLGQRQSKKQLSRLISLSGVKGGVGVTTVAAGLAHAADAQGYSAVLVDLSSSAALLHYMAAPRWQSSELATALLDGIPPDGNLVDRCIVTSANGTSLFLPPAGSAEVRELWLRDPKRLDYSLSCLEYLKDRFDFVIVDLASAEGLLPFAIQARSNIRLLVSSNDPASVHLLSRQIAECSNVPGDGETICILSMLIERGLNREDILDFLLLNKNFKDAMARLPSIPFDSRGKNWVGTGNTFFTESKRPTQTILESVVRLLISCEVESEDAPSASGSRWPSLELLRRSLTSGNLRPFFSRRTLPFLPRAADPKERAPEPLALVPNIASNDFEAIEDIPPFASEDTTVLYEPPRFAVNE